MLKFTIKISLTNLLSTIFMSDIGSSPCFTNSVVIIAVSSVNSLNATVSEEDYMFQNTIIIKKKETNEKFPVENLAEVLDLLLLKKFELE